jgi:uncharacterized membrane protein
MIIPRLFDAAETVGRVFEKSESIFTYIVKFCVLAIELVGVCVVIFAVIRAVIGIFKKDEFLRLNLAEGIALALEFKMGGELLRTVIAREWSELLVLGAVILLRAAMAFLIQWEIRIEKKNGMTMHGMDRALEEN